MLWVLNRSSILYVHGEKHAAGLLLCSTRWKIRNKGTHLHKSLKRFGEKRQQQRAKIPQEMKNASHWNACRKNLRKFDCQTWSKYCSDPPSPQSWIIPDHKTYYVIVKAQVPAIKFTNQPDNSHFQHVLNEWTAELTKICIRHVIGHPKYRNKRLSFNLKRVEGYLNLIIY